jgi:hypothetical protein
MTVKYQVERRPIGPTGKIYRGTQPGDYVSILSNPYDTALGGATGMVTSVKAIDSGSGGHASYVPAGNPVPDIVNSSSNYVYSHVVEVTGEPWLVYSTHFSIESALDSAAPLASAVGKDNIRIVKVLNHNTQFTLS